MIIPPPFGEVLSCNLGIGIISRQLPTGQLSRQTRSMSDQINQTHMSDVSLRLGVQLGLCLGDWLCKLHKVSDYEMSKHFAGECLGNGADPHYCVTIR
jgi:hypothetical protein